MSAVVAEPGDDTGAFERLAYETARDALAQQAAVLNDLRTRTGTLLAASSIAASFLGGEALRRAGLDIVVLSGLLLFVASVVGAIWILLPKRVAFAVDAQRLYEELYPVARDMGMAEVHRSLAYWMQARYEANSAQIAKLGNWFGVVAGTVVLEVILWGIRLANP